MLSVYPSIGPDWKHELAAFRRLAAPAEPLGGPSRSALESSDGRDCKFGSIRWPRPQKDIATATHRQTSRFQLARAGGTPRTEDGGEEPRIAQLFAQEAPSHCYQAVVV
jgi:hypothetical protein